jgi:hypothetical protein
MECIPALPPYRRKTPGGGTHPLYGRRDARRYTVVVSRCAQLLLYVGFILFVAVSLITAGLLFAWSRRPRRSGNLTPQTSAQVKPDLHLESTA